MNGKFYCVDNTDLLKGYKEKLNLARQRIKEFPTLDCIFNHFNDYEFEIDQNEYLPNNVVFNLLIADNYKVGYTQNNLRTGKGTYFELNELENGLNRFFNKEMETNAYNEFKKRLKSKDNFTSIEALTEILVGFQISETLNQNTNSNIDLHYELPNGKKPDLLLTLDHKKIFIELTGLNVRLSEFKITKITSAISKYILSKYKKKGFIIAIDFDVSYLIKDDKGHIDEERSITFLKCLVDDLYLQNLEDFECVINFRDYVISISQEDNKSIKNVNNGTHIYINRENNSDTEIFHLMQLPENRSKLILKHPKFPIFEKWSKVVKLKNFMNSPFKSISIQSSNASNLCVYIYSIETNFDDSNRPKSFLKESELVKSAFLRQIERAINEKMKVGQYETGNPFIIAIKAHQWRFQYETDYTEFIPVRDYVQKILKKHKDLSGVILFTNQLYYGRYIENLDSSNQITITEHELEEANVLFKHHEPLLSHDKKINFSKLDYLEKTKRIEYLLNIESEIDLNRDDLFHPYGEQDLYELFEDLYRFLNESKIDEQLLARIDSLIKKYCILNDTKGEDVNKRNDSIYDNQIVLLGHIPPRAYAASCQVIMTKHNPTHSNLLLTMSLSKDSNSYVRDEISKNLRHLYDVFPLETIEIAKRYCTDNKYVRWYLRDFMNYLYHKDSDKALNLFKIIINKYGKSTLPHGEAHEEHVLLNFVISLITQVVLIKEQKEYHELFNELVNGEFSDHIKHEIITTLREDRFISDPVILEKIIDIYLKLLDNGSNKVKADIEFFFLYKLKEIDNSLYPQIKNLLNNISKIKYTESIIGFSHDYHFTILDYLAKFCDEFPEEAAKYLITILELNEFLYNSVKTSIITKILEKLLDKNLKLEIQESLFSILKKMDKSDWRILKLMNKFNMI